MPVQMPTWSQTKTTSKAGFDKVYNVVDKLGAPINRLSNKVGAEAFWPTTLDKESDKAARILKSFCKDGFYVEEAGKDVERASGKAEDGKPKGKQRVLKKIPSQVIKEAKGLAIFTTMRTGLWVSGAGGSGILIARKADGSWSPPSGILLHTAGLGFLVGVDIYDCVVVINTARALEAFTKIRCTLGGEISATAGPVGMGGVLESELHKRQAPVFNYLKSRGFYAGVQVDGTVIIQRQDENERFYGEKREVDQILRGEVRRVPPETRTLLATIQMAQGDEVDESLLPGAVPTPGDLEVQLDDNNRFGLPPPDDDPDPYGVKALQQEGLVIKEITGSGEISRPSMDAFEYRPAPSSPIFNHYRDSMYKRHSKRASHDSGRLSISSMDRGTQTDSALDSPRFLDSPKGSGNHSPVKKTTENLAEEPEEDEEEGSDPEDTVTVHEPVVIQQAKVISIPRRVPPPLPARNPHRSSALNSPAAGAEFPTSPLAQHVFGGSGLGISNPAASPSHSVSAGDNASVKSLEPIHLTTSQNETLAEELSQVHLSPRQQRRLSPVLQETSSSDFRVTGDGGQLTTVSSNYSGVDSPQETGPSEASDVPSASEKRDLKANGLTKSEAPASSVGFEEVSLVDNEVSNIQTDESAKDKDHDEFHSVPGTPVEARAPAHTKELGTKDDDFS